MEKADEKNPTQQTLHNPDVQVQDLDGLERQENDNE
jgi:hypothetical protein